MSSQVDVGAQKFGSSFEETLKNDCGKAGLRSVRRAREASVAWGRRCREKSMSSSMIRAVSRVEDKNLAVC